MMIVEDTTNWPLYLVPMGKYLGYHIALRHHKDDKYKLSITCPWEFGGTISDKSFTLLQKDEALSHAHELIEAETSSILPY